MLAIRNDMLHANVCRFADEVMALLEDGTNLGPVHISDSFNTKWREIGGHPEKTRRRRTRDDDEEAKVGVFYGSQYFS